MRSEIVTDHNYRMDSPPRIGSFVLLRARDRFLVENFGAEPGTAGIVRDLSRDADDRSAVSGAHVQWLSSGARHEAADPESTVHVTLNDIAWVRPDGVLVSPKERFAP